MKDKSYNNIMKVGILTHHNVPNYGANLQAYSSLKNFLKLGINAKIINYYSSKLEKNYGKKVSKKQISLHKQFIPKKYLTNKCKNEIELKQVFKEEKFTHIIVGSDAMIRLKNKGTPDIIYPNPYWLNWILSTKKVKKIFLSVSAMGSYYFLLNPIQIIKIIRNLSQFDMICVRDRWTYWTLKIIRAGIINIKMTPDPVSNLNSVIDVSKKPINYNKIIKNKRFILFSGQRKNYSEDWLLNFKKIINEKGFLFGELPMPEGYTGFKCFDFQVPISINPEDWYLWILNSNGYIGERFHALLSCVYNKKPFFIIDTYCNKFWKLLNFQYKSKIYDFCKNIHQIDNRVIGNNILKESPKHIFEKLSTMDYHKSEKYINKSRLEFLNTLKKIISLK